VNGKGEDAGGIKLYGGESQTERGERLIHGLLGKVKKCSKIPTEVGNEKIRSECTRDSGKTKFHVEKRREPSVLGKRNERLLVVEGN